MTQLYIDGHLCDLPTDFKITLVTENLYFSKASTYTYDIQLPIAPFSNNAKIFENINRLDKTIADLSFSARLLVDNKVIINGIATITDVKNDGISLQLLQGNSELNWKKKHEGTYIDELDLGDASEWGLGWEDGHLKITAPYEVFRDWYYLADKYHYWSPDYMAQYNNGDVLFTPIINATTGEVMNPIAFMLLNTYEGDWIKTWCLNDIENTTTPSATTYTLLPSRLAPQPKFSIIMQKIFNALNMPIVENELVGTEIYDNFFVANASEVYHIAEMLPHWTVPDFITEVQNLFNCVIDVKDDGTHIVLRKNFYAIDARQNIVTLGNPVDGFETDVDSDQTADVSNSDLPKKYDIAYPNYGTMFLGDEFKGVAIVPKSELTSNANPYVFSRTSYGAKVSSPRINLANRVTGNAIDHFEEQPSDGRDYTTLKLLPVRPQDEQEMHYYYPFYEWNQGEFTSGKQPYNYNIYVPTAEGKDTEIERQNIQELLDALETPEERPTLEKLCLGFQWADFYKEVSSGNFYGKYPLLISLLQASHTDNDGVTVAEQPYDMSLIDRQRINGDPLKNLYAKYYSDTPVVTVNKTTIVNFVTDTLADVLKTFLIKNQLFACKQIKYTITAKGFDKIAEGEFYKL